MSSGKRWTFRKVFTATGSCGCGRGRKATDIIQPKLKSEISSDDVKNRHCDTSAAGSFDDDGCCRNSAANSPENHDRGSKCSETAKIRNSVAVAKVSDDPYGDFRQSMLQMIFENQIYSRDDLQQLLRCFLRLNSPHHHEVIVKAFLEIRNSCLAVASGGEESTPTPTPPSSSADTCR